MYRALGTAVAVLLVALGAWLLLGREGAPAPSGAREREEVGVHGSPPRLAARDRGGAVAPAPGDLPGPAPCCVGGARAPRDVTLEVVDTGDDAPLEGAEVRTAEGTTGRTDGRGLTTLRIVGGTKCRVRKAGYATRWVDVEAAGTTARVGLTPAPELRGVVVDDESGAPVAGAAIRAISREDPWRLVDEPEPSADDGRFLIAGVPSGTAVELRVLRPGWATVVVQAASPSPGDAPLDVRLGGGAVLTGIVRHAGAPAVGADVFVVERGADVASRPDPFDPGVAAHAVTDGNGRFRVRGLVAPSEVLVHAIGPGGASGRGAPSPSRTRGRSWRGRSISRRTARSRCG